MKHAHRNLRIPDVVKKRLDALKRNQPLWYVGPLETENGHDVETRPLAEKDEPAVTLDRPKVTSPTGKHPAEALREVL